MPKEMSIKKALLYPEILRAYQGTNSSAAKVPGRAW
jgi:hypothetical protein